MIDGEKQKRIEIGRRIEEARNRAKLTQGELGEKLGMHKSSIQRYESGQVQKIKIPVLDSIAAALNVNPSWIALKTDDPNMPTQIGNKSSDYSEDFQKLSPDEKKLLDGYRSLNELGKGEARKRVNELAQLEQYKQTDSSDEYESVPIAARGVNGAPPKLKKKKGKSVFDLPDYRGGRR